MITISIKPSSNLQPLIMALSNFRGGLGRAVSSAIRRTLRGGRQDAGRKIAERYVIPARMVTSTIKTKASGLTGSLSSSGRKNPLEKFKIKPRVRRNPAAPGGVYAQVLRAGGGAIRRAFLQRSGGVYERVGSARFPLRRFGGPSAPGMLNAPPVSNFIVDKMSSRFNINFEHEARAVLAGFL